MSQIKRIDYLSKGKGSLTKNYELKKRKITRTLDTLIDDAEEKSYSCKEKAEQILNSIKDVADDSDKITRKFNDYIDAVADAEGYEKSKRILEEAKKKLEETVEVEDEDDETEGKKVLKD